MRSKSRFLVIAFVGAGVFVTLVWWVFGVPLFRALTAAGLTMTAVAFLDYFAPQEKKYQLLMVAVSAGVMIGSGVWWVMPYSLPWHYYAITFALLACVEAFLDRWSDKFKKSGK